MMIPIRRLLCITSVILLALLVQPVPAVAGEIHQAIADGNHSRVAKLLADDPALVSLEANNDTHDLPLHTAVIHNDIEMVKLLLDAGSDVDCFDIDESTPLHLAGHRRLPEMLDFLIEKGADINRRDKNGAYSLSFAAWGGDPAIVQKLIDAGADLNNRSLDGYTLMHPAAARGLTDLFDLLVERGNDINQATNRGTTPIHFASQGGQIEMVTRLLEMGASPSNPDSLGRTPIRMALDREHIDVVCLLLDRGAPADVPDENGITPLFVASWRDNNELAQLLIDHGANPNRTDEDGRAPLWWAVQDGAFDLVKTLIDAGASTEIRDSQSGCTPVHVAARNGHKDIVALLLDNGASINIQDGANNTPYRFARQCGHRAVADLLLNRGARPEEVDVNRGLAGTTGLGSKEALVWYLGHSGWALQTENNLLIFDYFCNGREADEPGLCNGNINPAELNGEKVTVFSTHDHGDHFDPIILDWADKVGDLTYVYGFRPEESNLREPLPETIPPYEFVPPRQVQTVNGMKITTIESNDTGVGFVVEVDGLVIFHAGDHANRVPEQMTGYKPEIDWLAEKKVRPDIAFLPVTGCGFRDPEAVKQGVYYVIERLNPKLFVPMHAGNREWVCKDFIEKGKEEYPRTNMYAAGTKGDSFHYKNGKAS